MKIWFDVSNSPHIHIFKALIRDLEATGHDVVITARPLANTIDLLRLHGFPFQIVGKHYGASKVRKAYGYPVRIWQLYRYLRSLQIDVAISHSSFHSPVVAWMLGIPSIYMNDNEHTLGNVPSYLFATRVMVPEFMNISAVRKQGASTKKIIRYPGVKEGLYLWNCQLPSDDMPADEQPTVFVRPEPWTALYYDGAVGFLDDLLLGLRDRVRVMLLPRGVEQGERYRGDRFHGITVVDTPMTLEQIASSCDLFIGAGGTMTRELAVLGVPTVSVYQAELLDVDRYLIEHHLMTHNPRLTAAQALDRVRQRKRSQPNRELLSKGRDAYELMKATLLQLGGAPVPNCR